MEVVHLEPLPPVLKTVDLSSEWNLQKRQGKVRDIFKLPNGMLVFITTDRVSALDRQIGTIPSSGQILNQISEWAFEKTRDIINNHVVAVPDPNVTIAEQLIPIPIEMVVRGYLTGSTPTSILTRYNKGERQFGGVVLPDGMPKHAPLPKSIITPTTKATVGHDENLTVDQILERRLVTKEQWELLEEKALAIFARGQLLAQQVGLILVDTKYEFGWDPISGELKLMDEVNTPVSSRYWDSKNVQEARARGESPGQLDKELLRLWLAEQGYKGEGEPPQMPETVVRNVRNGYIQTYERLTTKMFEPAHGNRNEQIVAAIEPFL